MCCTGNVTIAKGLPAKVMNTADGGVDDAADQWMVENFKEMNPEVAKADKDFSKVSNSSTLLRLQCATHIQHYHWTEVVLHEPSKDLLITLLICNLS